MPKFHPTPIIQDCWSSIGNITFYHRNGQCFYKRKPYTQYRGTAAISAVPNLTSPATADRFSIPIRIRNPALPSHSPEHRQSRPLARISPHPAHRPGRGL